MNSKTSDKNIWFKPQSTTAPVIDWWDKLNTDYGTQFDGSVIVKHTTINGKGRVGRLINNKKSWHGTNNR